VRRVNLTTCILSSMRLSVPSIQPKQSASSAASSYDIVHFPVYFF
jgi:hypothetical protein